MKTFIGSAIAIALVTACSTPPGGPQRIDSPDSLSVTPRVDTATVGDTVRFVAIQGDTTEVVSWTISDSRVAAIMAQGAGWALVHALNPGATTVSAARAARSASGVLVVSSTRLAISVQPGSATAGAALTPAPTVMIEDLSGQPVTGANNAVTVALDSNGSAVTVALDSNGSGAHLSGTTTVTPVNGVATFSNLSIEKVGTGYMLTFSSSGSGHATSVPFAITAAAPAQLLFTQQPTIAVPLEPITPAVTVTIQDAFGNFVADATNAVTIAIGNNSGSGSLSGTTTVNAVSGVATFPNLSVDQPGAGYTLVASALGLSGAASDAFTIREPFVATAVSAGGRNSCGLTPTRDAYCWGSNISGQLGTGTTLGLETCGGIGPRGGILRFPCSSTPREVWADLNFAWLSVAGFASFSPAGLTCGVTPTSAAYCWGSNASGQLGDGTTTNRATPVAVSGGLSFASVSTGADHTCGVTTAGAAYCWGSNASGQLGDGTTTSSATPVAVSGGLTLAAVSTGASHTCGLTTAGAAYCWGLNGSGQLGDGTTTSSPTPVAVSGGLSFAAVTAGLSHTCAVTTAGAAYCWGSNASGQLGDGTPTSSPMPVAVSGGLSFAAVSAGGFHTCGVTTTGAAYCWGSNTSGQLGDGTTTGRPTPVAVSGGLSFAALSAGLSHNCGVTPAGAAYCWGLNQAGQLGHGTVGGYKSVPVRVVQ